MPGSGSDRKLGAGSELETDDFLAGAVFPDQAKAAAVVANDLFWGLAAPAPTVIPYSWLAPPATFRADQPINDPQVQQANGATAYAPNNTSINNYGDFPLAITLNTISAGDPAALATYLNTYYSGFRMRNPSLTINLLDAHRTQADVWRILGIRIGDRISIPDAPATWPEGANTLFVEGIYHSVSQNERLVTFNCSPVIGATPGVVGPWFRDDSSVASGTDAGPF